MLRHLPSLLTALGLCLMAFWLGFFAFLPPVVAPTDTAYLPESEQREAPDRIATLTVVGDIMLARDVETAIAAQGIDWPYEEVKDLWADSDLVVGNFESTIRDAYRYEGEVLAFDVIPAYVQGLVNAGFTHLSLANNHGDDFGSAVTDSTRGVIADLGITPFGDPLESELHIAHADAGGTSFAFVGFHAFIEDPDVVASAIAREDEQGYFVIVMPHWGNEYQTTPSIAQVEAAQMFIDAGADLIIGAHPHVIQPIEVVDGVPVAYSLGNFVFDQDWSVPTQQGLLLTVTVTDAAITVMPTAIHVDRQATPGDFPVQAALTVIR
ncbi:CapA family protein [Candidatus Uhrbacteria bacterium]|nr:CapA family protein [Candidatus Uhrbacteria bacterium]